ncbi:MAG: mechanosensitive ion channel protein [Peptococcaceae bacterium BICA1-8]|nr:MAG: mechanosensitive ion channel protein [Peptococcaceae bacterium BICA1-8]
MKFWEDILSLMEEFVFSESMWRIAGALAIIIFALLLRQVFVKFIVGMFRKLTTKTKSDIDDQLLEVLEKPARFAFIILGIYLAGQIINFSPNVQLFIEKISRSLILYTLFWAAYRATNTFSIFFKRLTEKTETKFDDMLASFLTNGLKGMIIIIGSITVTQVWFDEIAGILTGLGLGGLAFALAAKDTAANLFGSITIMIDRPFSIGDWIQTPHVEGTVEEMGFRSTRVRTFAQSLVTIPNSVMSNDPITNWSQMGKRRISYRLGVTYNTTSEQMRECVERLRKMLEGHPEVHKQTIFVYFESFGDNSLDIFLYFFTNTTNWQKFLEVQEDINLKIMDILKELGLSVAFPSRSIYIESMDKK